MEKLAFGLHQLPWRLKNVHDVTEPVCNIINVLILHRIFRHMGHLYVFWTNIAWCVQKPTPQSYMNVQSCEFEWWCFILWIYSMPKWINNSPLAWYCQSAGWWKVKIPSRSKCCDLLCMWWVCRYEVWASETTDNGEDTPEYATCYM